MSIIHSGAKPLFVNLEWSGIYKLNPLPIYDSAKMGIELKMDYYIALESRN
jgi:hypothetical protein